MEHNSKKVQETISGRSVGRFKKKKAQTLEKSEK